MHCYLARAESTETRRPINFLLKIALEFNKWLAKKGLNRKVAVDSSSIGGVPIVICNDDEATLSKSPAN